MAPTWQQQTVYSTPWFELVAKTRPGAGPDEPPHYAVATDDYVVIVALGPDGRLPMVRQLRPAVEQVTLEFPAGHVSRGEAPADAARRELREETGFDAATIDSLGVLTPDSARLANRLHCWFASGLSPAPGLSKAHEEGIEQATVSLPELRQMLHDGRFNHALHIAALMLAIERQKLPWNHP